MTENSASETAKLALREIHLHKDDCERRYATITTALDRLDAKLDRGVESLHSRISWHDAKFTSRWWSMLISVIAFLCLFIAALIGYIYVSEFKRISVETRSHTGAIDEQRRSSAE